MLKGNGRILYIFTTKSLIYSAIGAGVGFIFYYLIGKMLGKTFIGIAVLLIFAAIGYGIAMLKIPESNRFEMLRKTGGEKIDDVIVRYIKFRAKGNRIYIQKKKEEDK